MEGWLRQKRSRGLTAWEQRYLVLVMDPPRLQCFSKPPPPHSPQQTPKASHELTAECVVTEVEQVKASKKSLFSFHIIWPNSKTKDDDSDEEEDEHRERSLREIAEVEANSHKKTQKRIEEQLALEDKNKSSTAITGAKVAAVAVGGVVIGALTVVGVVPYLIAVGIAATAAGGGAVALDLHRTRKKLTLAAQTMEDALRWRNLIDSCVCVLAGRKQKIPDQVSYKLASHVFDSGAQWRCVSMREGVCVLEDRPPVENPKFSLTRKAVGTLKTQCVVNTPALDCFLYIMEFNEQLRTDTYLSDFSVSQQLDEHTDVVYLKWTIPCVQGISSLEIEACVLRYWRLEEDGTYIVTMNSTDHESCPSRAKRIELQAVYVIAPPKDGGFFYGYFPESLVTCACHLSGFMKLQVMFGLDAILTDAFLRQISNTSSGLMDQRFARSKDRRDNAQAAFVGDVVTTQPTGHSTPVSESSEQGLSPNTFQRSLTGPAQRRASARLETKSSRKAEPVTPGVKAESMLLKDRIAAKEVEIHRLEKLIRKEGRRVVANGQRKSNGTQEMLLRLQDQFEELNDLKQRYLTVNNHAYESERTIKKRFFKSKAKPSAAPRTGACIVDMIATAANTSSSRPPSSNETDTYAIKEIPPLPGKWLRSDMGARAANRDFRARVRVSLVVVALFCVSFVVTMAAMAQLQH